MRKVFLLITCFALGACSEDSNICKANVEAKLLNPETAEFYSFREFKENEYKTMTGVDDPFLELTDPGGSELQAAMVAESYASITNTAERLGMKPYLYRVRSEDEIGRTITEQFLCFTNDTMCECSPSGL